MEPLPESERYSNTAGFVYILSNPSMPGIFKIGSTERSVKERVAELSATTGVPTPFHVEHYILTEDPKALEHSLHEELSEFRVNGNREFFRIEIDELKRKCEEMKTDVLMSEIKLLNEDSMSLLFRELMWLHPNNPTLLIISEYNRSEITEFLLTLNDDLLIEIIQTILRKKPKVWKGL